LGPARDRAERRLRPVMGADPADHLALAPGDDTKIEIKLAPPFKDGRRTANDGASEARPRRGQASSYMKQLVSAARARADHVIVVGKFRDLPPSILIAAECDHVFIELLEVCILCRYFRVKLAALNDASKIAGENARN
jgi:hypothetical protein